MTKRVEDDFFIRSPKGRVLQHFVDAMEDLRDRCRLTATTYDTAQAAGIVRRLLIDGNPLAVAAGKITQLTPEFSWSRDMYTGDDWEFIISGHHFDPALHSLSIGYSVGALGRSVVRGNHDELLKSEVLRHGNDVLDCVSTRDFIKWLANDEGGVHVEMFHRPEIRRRFRDAQASVPEHTKWTMIAIGRVVYCGLEPTLFSAARALQLLNR